jgi:hypothetical protein
MSRLQFLVAVTAALVSSVPASAHFGLLFRPRSTSAYYYAVPVVEVCIPPVVWVPVEAPPRLFAQPLPAPATSGKEPPLADPGKKLPISSESRKAQSPTTGYFDSYSVAATGTAARADGLCSVSFWNLSPVEMTLKIGEKRTTLPAGRNVTLDLERQFQWQIEGREVQKGQVAANDKGVEIVIRR